MDHGRGPWDERVDVAAGLAAAGHSARAEALLIAVLADEPNHLVAAYDLALLLWRDGRLSAERAVHWLDGIHDAQAAPQWRARLASLLWREAGAPESARAALDGAAAPKLTAAADAAAPRTLASAGARAIATSARVDAVLAGAADGSVSYWPSLDADAARALAGAGPEVTCVALSDDGSIAAAGDATGRLRVWDTASGELRTEIAAHKGAVVAIAVTAEGSLVGSAGADKKLTVSAWRPKAATQSWFQEDVHAVAFPAGHRHLATVNAQANVRFWDFRELRVAEVLTRVGTVLGRHASWIAQLLASGRDVRVASLPLNEPWAMLRGHVAAKAVALSEARDRAAVAQSDGTIAVWKLPGQRLATLRPFEAPLADVRFSSTSNRLVALSAEGQVRILPLADPEAAPFLNSRAEVATPINAPSPHPVPAPERASAPPALRRTARTRLLEAYPGPVLEVGSSSLAAFWLSRSGRSAIGRVGNDGIRRFDTRSGEVLRDDHGPQWSNLASLHPTRDGTRAISVHFKDVLREWDLASGRCERELPWWDDGSSFWGLADQGRIALTSGSGALVVREVATGRVLRGLQWSRPSLLGATISDDGRLVVATSAEHVVAGDVVHTEDILTEAWEVGTGHRLWQWEDAQALLLSPAGRLLVAPDALVDPVSRERVLALPPFTRRCAFSPDGALCVASVQDEPIRILEIATGQCLGTLAPYADDASIQHGLDALALSADASTVLTAHQRGARVWHLVWEHAPADEIDWDDRALPILERFVESRRPIGPDGFRTDGPPAWTEEDLRGLEGELAWSGYGWIRRAELLRRLGH